MTIPSWITKTLKFVRNFFLWILFGLSMLFFSVGVYFYKEADEGLEYGFWGTKPEAYAKNKTAAHTMERLVRYAEKHHVPVYQFKGPYFEEHLGLDFPTYMTCFKHPTHYFCYDDWQGETDAGSIDFGEKNSGHYEWLKKQPD